MTGAAASRFGPTFDLTGPLPSGTTVLEASAGTGKTFTIAGLVVRWVAETTLRLPQLLVVTFTRAATAELRDRVRRRLVAAADHLEAVAGGADPAHGDPVLAHLADARPAAVRDRHRRLARALTDVDAATITTIHGFCQHVLDGLGLVSDFDREAELVEDTSELVAEVVDDLLVSTYLERGDTPTLSRSELLSLGETVVANPTTMLVPRAADDAAAGLRLHLAERIRAEVARRAARRRQWSYDDLLTRLDDTLRDPDRGGAARRALRRRYRVALIDEFQDTDPVQWSIVERAFAGPDGDADGDRALVLIGDPKQAIYAFRGADVYAYLDARASAGSTATLSTSWRADAGLLAAFDTLLAGARFGDEDIAHRPVDCAPGHERPRLDGAPDTTPLRLRLLPRHDELDQHGDKITADPAREIIAADVAADLVALLGAEPTLIDRDRDGSERERRVLEPGDVAVLVRSNREAGLVGQALDRVAVPSVVNGVDSVFATPATTDWQRLLDALERPASTRRVRALALSCWVGWTGAQVATADEEAWERLHEDVHRWARLVREQGVASLQRSVSLQRRVRPRLLASPDGARRLADLEHIGELAHAAVSAEHLGPAALAGWLRDSVEEASARARDEQLRRLETDDDAVQILTIHRSKGLEFPVVYAPFLWSSHSDVRGAPVFHGDDRRRRIDVGGEGHADYDEHEARAEAEARGEELRLAYVAMTRAAHQVVVHWAPAGRPEWSPLGRLLFSRRPDGTVAADRPVEHLPGDEQARTAARALADRSGGTIRVGEVPPEPSRRPWTRPRPAPERLAVAAFDRGIDHAWRRTSYTALTRADEPDRVGSEPDEPVKDDEQSVAPDAPGRSGDDPHGLREVPLPLADMPGGTEIGTFVHRVLEHSDFAAPDLEAELRGTVAEQAARRRLDLDHDRVVAGLAAALRSDLGPLAAGSALADVTRADRRDEVDFELALCGRTAAQSRGSSSDPRLTPRGTPAEGAGDATVGEVVDLLGDHLRDGDPLAAYPARVAGQVRSRNLRGYLAGSIDLVLRLPRDGRDVFLVVDYKTNWLAPPGEELTGWHYRPAALAEAMIDGDYVLQAVLYQAALHRYLRWRVPRYEPAVHLGGVLYPFVRGMVGSPAPAPGDGPSRLGVFAWDPPAELVVAVSDRLHGVAA